MNEINDNINQILVSLDFDDNSSSFIESLVTLASQLQADLCGLFIEDSQLQQIANLPFSREITFPLAHTRNLNSEQIARHLKQHEETLRKLMKEFSQLSNVACSFRTTKGPRIESILRESINFQLIVLLPENYSSLKSRQAVKLADLINPTVLLFDKSKQAQKSAYIVRSLADHGDLHQLKILTVDHDSYIAAKQLFTFDNVKVNYHQLESFNIADIISVIGSQKSGLVILPLEDGLINQDKGIRKILDVLDCPLLLVR